MSDKALYNVFLPDVANPRNANQRNRKLFEAGTLASGPAAVEDLSGDPAERTVEGMFRGHLADLMFEDLEEISEISDVSIPFYRIDESQNVESWAGNGYYKVERVEDTTPDARTDQNYVEFRATLKRVGGHETHFRSVESSTVSIDHPFGNDLTAEVTIPSTASKVRWFNEGTEEYEAASSIGSLAIEDGAVDVYDTEDSTFENPKLIYEAGFGEGHPVDPTVWDDHGRLKVQTTSDGTEYNGWQHVFDETHEYHGDPVADNGYYRLHIDESAEQFTAEEWDDGSSSWTDVGLDWAGTDWAVFDWDFTEITPASIRAHVVFEHPSDGFYSLNVTLHRGADAVQFSIPSGQSGPVPSALESLLTPIASTTLKDPQITLGLVHREDVRR